MTNHPRQPPAPVRPIRPSATGVMQGFFPGGTLRLPRTQTQVVQPRTVERGGSRATAVPSSFMLPMSHGKGLPGPVLQQMESVFGADFSSVRLHVGAHVQAMGALAFTMGDSIHFAPGQYQPETARGRQLLGHELAHVVQQRAQRVRNPFGSGLAVVQDRALEAEAERMGIRAATAPPAGAAPPPARPSAPAGAPRPGGLVQRARVTKSVHDEAKFLRGTSRTLFAGTKSQKKGKNVMEVQSSIFDGRMFIASNYTRGDDDSALKNVWTGSYTRGDTTYTGKTLVSLAGTLHAEQQILYELAKVLKNTSKAEPGHVTVVGSKRPCSVCRRVLVAFDRALHRSSYRTRIHFVDQTGETTDVSALDLDALARDADPLFQRFVELYNQEREKIWRRKLTGEEVSKSIRTRAKPSLKELL